MDINILAIAAGVHTIQHDTYEWEDPNTSYKFAFSEANLKEFTRLIVEQCRDVIDDVYHDTPLELCGPLLVVDEKIVEHFHGVDYERTY